MVSHALNNHCVAKMSSSDRSSSLSHARSFISPPWLWDHWKTVGQSVCVTEICFLIIHMHFILRWVRRSLWRVPKSTYSSVWGDSYTILPQLLMPSCLTSSRTIPRCLLSTMKGSRLMLTQQVRQQCWEQMCKILEINMQNCNLSLNDLTCCSGVCSNTMHEHCMAVSHAPVSIMFAALCVCQERRSGSAQVSTSPQVWRPTWSYQQRLSTRNARYSTQIMVVILPFHLAQSFYSLLKVNKMLVYFKGTTFKIKSDLSLQGHLLKKHFSFSFQFI